MPVSKKKVIKSLEGLDDSLKELMKKQYPTGYQSSVTRIINAKKEHIFVFPLETDDATYLIKVPSSKNSDGEYNVDFGKKAEFERPDDADDFAASGESDDLESSDGDFEGDEDGASKDPSYEPDFDN
jgi:hypothetical protein